MHGDVVILASHDSATDRAGQSGVPGVANGRRHRLAALEPGRLRYPGRRPALDGEYGYPGLDDRQRPAARHGHRALQRPVGRPERRVEEAAEPRDGRGELRQRSDEYGHPRVCTLLQLRPGVTFQTTADANTGSGGSVSNVPIAAVLPSPSSDGSQWNCDAGAGLTLVSAIPGIDGDSITVAADVTKRHGTAQRPTPPSSRDTCSFSGSRRRGRLTCSTTSNGRWRCRAVRRELGARRSTWGPAPLRSIS